MVKPRRMGAENSKIRERFIKAAEDILKTEGHASISARLVAAKADLTAQLLYYYFRTMDDLLLAVVRSFNEDRLQRFEEALASPEPLRALWELSYDPSSATLAVELTSIASHREEVREEIIRYAELFRARQIEAVSRLLPQGEGAANGISAAGVVMIAVGLARLIVTESALGLTAGHEEVLNVVETTLSSFAQE